ncbi:SRPBCC family protein [Croceicoccus sp. BE223]|uniref:aromatic ring-hydroxylating oxygenase subunit alpha n=1 Tax=Croceicoccus sp. BE223 TaxID=2817716 RepID=UPI002855CD85|nr:SRPBCC family protein [Croceicoccus sp. BE223]MDR7101902.1 phenylpropionate dioxygenase-like ring-hydroxylating dioxygenase large terminal subunit [Croceicoccus sp. BE223]
MDRAARIGHIGEIAETMLGYVENKTTFQGEGTMRVPAASYCDEAIFRNEMDVVFHKLPLLLAFTAEMPNPGDYKAMDAVGKPVLITRDKDGTVRAFLNVCSHRGAPVAEEGRGNCPRFTCKYHSWTFGRDGKLIGINERQTFGDVDKAELGLRQLPCEERAGMIFVVLDPNGAIDLDAYYRGYLADFEDLGLADWHFVGNRTIHGANWKIAFDGYLEGYHFQSLHPETIFPRTPTNCTHYEGFGPSMRIGFPQHEIGNLLKDVPRGEWGTRENYGYDFVRILFPNVSIFVAPEITQVAQLFPGPKANENRTVLSYLSRNPPRDEEEKAKLEGMADFFRDVTYEEDYVIGMQIQKGLESGAHENLIFGKNERGNQYFHEWLNWYVAQDPTQPEPEM